MCTLHANPPSPLSRLGYEDVVPDGFYDLVGDFPEVAEPGELPSLASLRQVALFEGDSREVGAGGSLVPPPPGGGALDSVAVC